MDEPPEDQPARASRSITRRTSQLPFTSKLLYHVDYYSAKPVMAVAVVAALVIMVLVGALTHFSRAWVTTAEITMSSITLFMVFTIQHTQSRAETATQRKLDELLRATPGAAEALIMLEEKPQEFMLEVEEVQRDVLESHEGVLDENAPAYEPPTNVESDGPNSEDVT